VEHLIAFPVAVIRVCAIKGPYPEIEAGAAIWFVAWMAPQEAPITRINNRAFVLAQYFGYLRRDPNSGRDSDYTGYDFWLTKLNKFKGTYIAAEMVKAFISSDEYRHRFGP
jgi:hypothetical protein